MTLIKNLRIKGNKNKLLKPSIMKQCVPSIIIETFEGYYIGTTPRIRGLSGQCIFKTETKLICVPENYFLRRLKKLDHSYKVRITFKGIQQSSPYRTTKIYHIEFNNQDYITKITNYFNNINMLWQ